MASQGFVRIGTILVPYPDYESGMQTVTTLVDGGRNQYGVFIGQRIGRDQSKIEMQWTRMDIATWTDILQAFDASFVQSGAVLRYVQGHGRGQADVCQRPDGAAGRIFARRHELGWGA